MAIELADLIESLRREINPPGVNLFPDATDSELEGHLIDGFWNAVVDGVISGYREEDGVVEPRSGQGPDLSRELQQVVVFYAGFRIALNTYRQIKTSFRAKAGPVEYETAYGASVLTALLKQLADRRALLLARLSDMGVTSAYVVDGVQERTKALLGGESWWVR